MIKSDHGRLDVIMVSSTSPRSPLSGRLCRDVTPAASFRYPL